MRNYIHDFPIANHAKDSTLVFDKKGTIVYASPSTKMLLGVSPKIVHLKNIGEFVEKEETLTILQSKTSFTKEMLVRKRDSSWVWVEANIFSMTWRKTKFRVAIFHDISARKRTSELHKQMLNAIPQLVWSADTWGKRDFLSHQWTEYTGAAAKTHYGDMWIQAIHPDDRERAWSKWEEAVQNQLPYETESRIRRFDGLYLWFYTRGVPLLDEKGTVMKWFGTCTNIQLQKDTEKRKDDFISITSHELKTPLTSIKGYAQIATGMIDKKKYDEVSQTIKKQTRSIEQLNRLVSDLLDYSRIQAGKFHFEEKTLSFDTLISETIDHISPLFSSHTITIRGETKSIVFGDHERIEQVVTNLVTNAVKYSPNAKKIDLSLRNVDHSVELAIRDYGIGIPEEEQDKIFQRFYRTEYTFKRFSGLGMGLYISHEIIKRHKGKLWFTSNVGIGSTFFLSLPRYE